VNKLNESADLQRNCLSTIAHLASEEKCIDVVWLYGSRVRGQADESSDYDLAVAINANKTPGAKPLEYLQMTWPTVGSKRWAARFQ
jgi:predicted nucleotidyltransferase